MNQLSGNSGCKRESSMMVSYLGSMSAIIGVDFIRERNLSFNYFLSEVKVQ